MMAWASRSALIDKVADVPENWLMEFMVNQPEDVRKFGTARNARVLFRVPAVIDAIDKKRYFRTAPADLAGQNAN